MKNTLTKISASVLWAALGLSAPAWAADSYEQDDTSVVPRQMLLHRAPSALRDTDPAGKVGNFDVDFMGMNAFPGHSYEVLIERLHTNFTPLGLTRIGFDGTTVLQTGISSYHLTEPQTSDDSVGSASALNSARFLRWIEPSPSVTRFISVTGQVGVNEVYTAQLRETTLFCPRYNNTGTQASVLLIHRASPDDLVSFTPACSVLVGFYAEDPSVNAPATLAGSISQNVGHANTWTLAAATVPGVAGTRGAVRIAHNCSWGGLAAKVVALEPATGFTFDTPCDVRPPN